MIAQMRSGVDAGELAGAHPLLDESLERALDRQREFPGVESRGALRRRVAEARVSRTMLRFSSARSTRASQRRRIRSAAVPLSLRRVASTVGAKFAEALLHQREVEALLALEVVIEDRFGHPGGGDDLPDGGRSVPLAAEEVGRFAQQAIAGGTGRISFLPRFPCVCASN